MCFDQLQNLFQLGRWSMTKDIEYGGYILNHNNPFIIELTVTHLIIYSIGDQMIINVTLHGKITQAVCKVIYIDKETNQIYLLPDLDIQKYSHIDIHSTQAKVE